MWKLTKSVGTGNILPMIQESIHQSKITKIVGHQYWTGKSANTEPITEIVYTVLLRKV
jgi:hypothetical protein